MRRALRGGTAHEGRQRQADAKQPRLAITPNEADNAVAASAEGYSFPTNLDRDPPKGGMAPKNQQDLMRQALKENWPPDVFVDEAEAQAWRKLT